MSTPLVELDTSVLSCARSVQSEGSMAKRKPTDMVQMNLRLRESLRQKIEALAKKSDRSLNGELVHLLEYAVTAEQLGLGGIDGLAKAASGSSAMNAVVEMAKLIGIDKEV